MTWCPVRDVAARIRGQGPLIPVSRYDLIELVQEALIDAGPSQSRSPERLQITKDEARNVVKWLERAGVLEAPVDTELLYSTTDAAVWSAEFVKVCPEVDEGLMITWFANAIETARAAVPSEGIREAAEIAQIRSMLDERRHVIQFTDDGWTIAHPLHERLDLDSLFDCDMRWDDDDPGVRGRFWLNDDGTIGAALGSVSGEVS